MARKRKGMTDREKARFEKFLREQRRAKGLPIEQGDKSRVTPPSEGLNSQTEHDPLEPAPEPEGYRRCWRCFTSKEIVEFLCWDEHGRSQVASECYHCRSRRRPDPYTTPVRMEFPKSSSLGGLR
jgi:hypothetical protein